MELYRYDRYYGPDQIIKIVLNAFTVDKETPCGYWIEKKHDYQKGRWISQVGREAEKIARRTQTASNNSRLVMVQHHKLSK